MDIPLARSDYFRGVAKEAHILMRNRYFEENPVLSPEQSALLARMGLKRWLQVGEGPVRAVYSQPGSFDDALFVAAYDQLYRVDKDETITHIGTIESSSIRNAVSMAATSNIGETPAYLFIAAGSSLMCYMEDGWATGTFSGNPANNDVVRVDLMYYKFTNAGVDVGAPAGTVANPWLVALGGSTADAMQNLADAFGNTGTPGVDYSTALDANSQIIVQSVGASSVSVRATLVGVLGNAIITTETGAATSWLQGGTLDGGGDASYFQVPTPDDVGIISVGYIASYVVCVPAQGQGINGRFFWIDPGETVIDPLDFATAERAPDPISGVIVFGDNFWLPGSTTTEVWNFTGNDDSPVSRLQGVVFDRGSWEGTAVAFEDAMIIVDSEGGVFDISGEVTKISRPDIEQQIREAIQYQAQQTLPT